MASASAFEIHARRVTALAFEIHTRRVTASSPAVAVCVLRCRSSSI
jgi:hypothetical protein